MERVKGLHKKTTASSFGPLVPIGTDGTLVDMLSGLDNEQELKLGGNHIAEISEDGNSTTIIEQYCKNDAAKTIVYTVKTIVTDNADGSTTITINIYNGDSTAAADKLNTKIISIPVEIPNQSLTIEEELQ